MSIWIPPRQSPAAPPQPAVKAGPLGPGAGVLQTEFTLSSLLGRETPQERMRQYAAMARQVLWVRSAERVIGDAFAGVGYHLEDAAGDTAERDDATPLEQDALALLDAPMAHVGMGQPLTRSALWKVTSRLLGVCGSYFWLKDQPNAYGIPLAFKGISPWRMTPTAT